MENLFVGHTIPICIKYKFLKKVNITFDITVRTVILELEPNN